MDWTFDAMALASNNMDTKLTMNNRSDPLHECYEHIVNIVESSWKISNGRMFRTLME